MDQDNNDLILLLAILLNPALMVQEFIKAVMED